MSIEISQTTINEDTASAALFINEQARDNLYEQEARAVIKKDKIGDVLSDTSKYTRWGTGAALFGTVAGFGFDVAGIDPAKGAKAIYTAVTTPDPRTLPGVAPDATFSSICYGDCRTYKSNGISSLTKYSALAATILGVASFASAGGANIIDAHLEEYVSYTSSRAKFFEKMMGKYEQPQAIEPEDAAILAALEPEEIDILPEWVQAETLMAQRDIGIMAMKERGQRLNEMTITTHIDYTNDPEADFAAIRAEHEEVMAYRGARKGLRDHKSMMQDMFATDLEGHNALMWKTINDKTKNGEELTVEEVEFRDSTPLFPEVNQEAIDSMRRTKANLGTVAVAGAAINHVTPGGNKAAGAAGAGAAIALIVITAAQAVHAYETTTYDARRNRDVDHLHGLHDAKSAKVDLRARDEAINAFDKIEDDIRDKTGQKDTDNKVSIALKPRTLAHRIGLIN